MPENHFKGKIATDYASLWPHLFEPGMVDPPVNFLADLAQGGDVLELGIGTGRLGLPLSRRGLAVYGIEMSPDMITQMRRDPGGDVVDVTLGDFASTQVEAGKEAFSLAYLVRNTIMNLTTQDDQVACFANVAWHLRPGGRFVIEVMVPELRRLPPGETVRMFSVDPAHLGFEEYDVVTQGSISHHIWDRDGEIATFSAPFRYVWPAELDLMARLAGMSLRERWSDWDRTPFTSESRSHISVWEKV
ncbi:MAG TPA: class I SAM-dependent methyltransferase [Acidimicrobiales bacterium]|nr:class I SAM-dependent methyltransferase [Acidimicrobiales bacterium]